MGYFKRTLIREPKGILLSPLNIRVNVTKHKIAYDLCKCLCLIKAIFHKTLYKQTKDNAVIRLINQSARWRMSNLKCSFACICIGLGILCAALGRLANAINNNASTKIWQRKISSSSRFLMHFKNKHKISCRIKGGILVLVNDHVYSFLHLFTSCEFVNS